MNYEKQLAMTLEKLGEVRKERDTARRDYEVMNKFREHAEKERDDLAEALRAAMRYFDQVINESGYVSGGEQIAHENAHEALKAYRERQ